MTEAKWLACHSPRMMLTYLKGRASDRKLRLFALACCGLIAEWIDDPRSRATVAVAEQYADGEATEAQRDVAVADIFNHCREPGEHVRGCWVVDLLLGKK